VAGGPADPGAWDHWFGHPSALSEGEGEAVARAHKVSSLPQELADLYQEIREERAASQGQARLLSIQRKATAFPEEWLLQAEVQELEART
jgi:phenylalanine-4-hydroxylase